MQKSNKGKGKSFVKKAIFFIIFVLIVWTYRHFDEITGYRFKEKAFNDSIKARLLSHESSLIEEYAEEQHRNNPNYTFDIKEAEKMQKQIFQRFYRIKPNIFSTKEK